MVSKPRPMSVSVAPRRGGERKSVRRAAGFAFGGAFGFSRVRGCGVAGLAGDGFLLAACRERVAAGEGERDLARAGGEREARSGVRDVRGPRGIAAGCPLRVSDNT